MGGEDSGFGIDLFDDQLIMIHLKQFLGPYHLIKSFMMKMFTGDLAKNYFESKVPSGVEVKVANQFMLENHDFHFITDGTTSVGLKGNHISVESLPEAIPYFVL